MELLAVCITIEGGKFSFCDTILWFSTISYIEIFWIIVESEYQMRSYVSFGYLQFNKKPLNRSINWANSQQREGGLWKNVLEEWKYCSLIKILTSKSRHFNHIQIHIYDDLALCHMGECMPEITVVQEDHKLAFLRGFTVMIQKRWYIDFIRQACILQHGILMGH